jgi:hypothetical protein
LAAAGCEDCPFRSNGAVAVCENTGAGETKKIPATAKASRIVTRLRILPSPPFGAIWFFYRRIVFVPVIVGEKPARINLAAPPGAIWL